MHRLLLLVAFAMFAQAASASKYAFILSNADYDELPDLNNTHADAEAYGEAFTSFGFQVSHHRDLSRRDTEHALDSFLNRIKPGDQVAFVYAGHGWSDGQINYLIPIDAPQKDSVRILKRQSFALRNGINGLLDELEAIGVSLTVAIIDACRDNPFESTDPNRSIGMSRGLTRVIASKGTFVIYSAGEGQQALDGLPDDPPNQRLSVFTRVFVPLLVSGATLEAAISSAQLETAQLALRSNGHLQHPAYYDQTLGDTCLKGDCLPPKQIAFKPKNEVCNALYQEAKSEKACFAYEAYEKYCPDHLFAPVAQSFMARNCTKSESEAVDLANKSTSTDAQQSGELELEIQVKKIEDTLRLSRSERKEIQQRLTLLDYTPGSADGIFGKRTRDAISSWQSANGIHTTGYFDSDQINVLKTQSDAKYEEFAAVQRNRQNIIPKSVPKPTKIEPEKRSSNASPDTNRRFTCRLYLYGVSRSTKRTEKLAREDVLAKCKSGVAGAFCSEASVICEETTNQ